MHFDNSIKIEWEEVDVKGRLAGNRKLIEVEKITLRKEGDPLKSWIPPEDTWSPYGNFRLQHLIPAAG